MIFQYLFHSKTFPRFLSPFQTGTCISVNRDSKRLSNGLGIHLQGKCDSCWVCQGMLCISPPEFCAGAVALIRAHLTCKNVFKCHQVKTYLLEHSSASCLHHWCRWMCILLFNVMPAAAADRLQSCGDSSLKATTKIALNSARFLDWLCTVAETYRPLLPHTEVFINALQILPGRDHTPNCAGRF